MPRPGVDILSRAQPVPRSAPTDTGVAFIVGAITPAAKLGPTLVRSITEFEAAFATRAQATALWDALDAYFRNGGGSAWVSTYKTVDVATDDTAIAKCLAAFDSGLGPGQLLVPGISTAATKQALIDAAQKSNRVALIDSTPSATAATLATESQSLKAQANARYGSIWSPRMVLPGIAGGTTRMVPFSPIEAGMISRSDARNINPNVAVAGVNGATSYALDTEFDFTDAEYTTLNTAGCNMARLRYGAIEAYGYRTLVDPTVTPEWLSFANARLNMAIVARANAIAERYVFAQIDGRGKKIAQFGGDLRGMLVPFWEAGALYGDTADEAFWVDVGAQVNTPTTIANGELHAVIEARMSPFAEYVVIEIVKVAITEALAA